MRKLAVRLSYGRHNNGIIGKLNPNNAEKNRYEDNFCVPGLQAYFEHWNASEFVIRDGHIPDNVKGMHKAYYLKANMFQELAKLDYDKVVFFDNDIQVVDWNFNLWELPTLSGPKAGYKKIFNKDIGLNYGLVVFDRDTIKQFAEFNPNQFDEYETWKSVYKIGYDEYILLSHINASGNLPNFINNIVKSCYECFDKKEKPPKFIHWIGKAWL